MKLLKNLIFIIFINFFISTFAFGIEKVAFINVEYVLQNSKIGKSILADLNKISEENTVKLKKIESKLKSEEDKIKQKKNIISEDELKKEINILKNKIKIFRNDRDKMINEFNKLKNKQIKNFFEKISPIIQEFMDEKSIEIILDRKKILMGKISSDISKDIVFLIDEKFN